MATFRPIRATSFGDAKSQLRRGETLVVANRGGDPKAMGYIPVTTWQTFDDHKSSCTFYARKG